MTTPHALSSRPRVMPFRGLRFTGSDATVAGRTFEPPSSWSQYAALDRAGLDTHHLLHLLEPVFGLGGGPENSVDVDRQLAEWIDRGVLAHDLEPAMYVYRRQEAHGDLVGLVGALRLNPDVGDPMLPHEQVIDRLVDAQEQLERTTHSQLEPIVAVLSGRQTVRQVVDTVLRTPPAVRFEESGVQHELWMIRDSGLFERAEAVVDGASIMIADGHHRFAAWSASAAADDERPGHQDGASDFGLTMLVDPDSVRLGPVHRVVPSMSLVEALTDVQLPTEDLPNAAAAVQYLHAGRENRSVLASIDGFVGVEALQCAPCWVHGEWADSHRLGPVDYVHDELTALGLAAERDGVAVLLAAPTFETVHDAATTGTPLPHKASSFGPKPRVGMIMRRWGRSANDVH